MTKIESAVNDFQQALKRFAEAMQLQESDIKRDAVIKRFEFTTELMWKALKSVLNDEFGVLCYSPKPCIKEAFQNNLLDYDEFWLDIINLRNTAAHVYDEEKVKEIYSQMPAVLQRFEKLSEKFTELRN